jgi:hypothetical protein
METEIQGAPQRDKVVKVICRSARTEAADAAAIPRRNAKPFFQTDELSLRRHMHNEQNAG